ncbi:MAG: hypothetical protein IT177_15400 [Acidobacteria bacterium]|nr:hypothetical protein [Acidobacteriota bacterium]
MRFPLTALALVAALGAACAAQPSASGARPAEAAQAPAQVAETPDIDHLAPVPDSVGATPARFEWSRIEGADFYLLRVWNEVDRLVFRADRLTDTSLAWPADAPLELGTYFWSVVALKDDRAVAESGLAAFVVTR